MNARVAMTTAVVLLGAWAAAAAEVEQRHVLYGGRQRTYYLYAPKSAGTAPAPLLVLLHGSGRDGQYMCDLWRKQADKHGVLLAAPDSLNSGTWGFGSDPPFFFQAVIESVAQDHAINRHRMYLFGASAGAHFALALSLLESKYFAGTAEFAGALAPQWYDVIKAASRRIPVAMYHGKSDPIVPLASARETMQRLRDAGLPVEWKEMAGVGHPYLPVASDVNRWAWEFLSKIELPGDPEFAEFPSVAAPEEPGPPPPGARPEASPATTQDCAQIAAGYPELEPVSAVCEFAASLRRSMPNFVCDQTSEIRRRISSFGRTAQVFDLITAEVTYQDGHDTYRNIRINNEPTRLAMNEIPGMATWGEFGEQFLSFFRPENAAAFTFRKESKLGPAAALVFDFHVAAENNRSWVLEDAHKRLYPEIRGSLWVEKGSHRLLRVAMEAVDDPAFSIRSARTSADYTPVKLGDLGVFLLPTHSETSMCFSNAAECATSILEFRHCRKFISKSRIVLVPPE